MFNKKMQSVLMLCLVFFLFNVSNAQHAEEQKDKIKAHQMDHQNNMNHSNYTSEFSNKIKALTDEELNHLLKGEGMGLAKAAELNSYPGPKHVLDFSNELNLTPKQKKESKTVFNTMQTEAIQLGELIIKKEKELDSAFRGATTDEKIVGEKIMEIARLNGKLRFVHLNAHLKQKEILTQRQILTYNKLRGYN